MRRSKNTLYCFSPPVMIATFVIEISYMAYTLWRYKMSKVTRLAALLLIFLATFQAAEFMVCRGATGHALRWSQIGYIAITMLPPLGVHLIYTIANVKRKLLLIPAYASTVAFTIYFALVGSAINGHACLGNYVIFEVAPDAGWLYGLYYYGLLLVAVWLALTLRSQVSNRKTKRALLAMVLGYMAFIVPTAAANLASPDTIRGIPSIMCGFAVLFATVLTLIVMPNAARERS